MNDFILREGDRVFTTATVHEVSLRGIVLKNDTESLHRVLTRSEVFSLYRSIDSEPMSDRRINDFIDKLISAGLPIREDK